MKINKILLISLLVLLTAALVLCMPEAIIDQNAATRIDYRNLANVHPSANTSISADGEGFQVTQNWVLLKASFLLSKSASPAGYLMASIFNTTGAFLSFTPTTILANSTTHLSMASLTASYVWYNFTFAAYILNPGQIYAIILWAENATLLNSVNYVRPGFTADSYTGSASEYSSSAWSTFGAGGIDMNFVLYGDSYPILTAGSVSASPGMGSTLCTFNSYWTGTEALSGFIFESNETGPPTNSSWSLLSGTADWANQIRTMPKSRDIIQYRWFVNGTGNIWTVTPYYHLTLLEPPGSTGFGAIFVLAFIGIIAMIGLVVMLKKR